ncbi:MAG: DUF2971 domain-containing protein [Gemmatimonas sp.]|uniref:DUF2971 domain-containing protein n=1 Tax=Gemmatimonas sp. TaxID=1962908 RepID=UPI0025C001E1|nr:DUF2971 domain-containing protein [Gemmatimonas sp.]MCA2988896.1 DUF2971 domain-containing protein [Gemmatimonas sp.]
MTKTAGFINLTDADASLPIYRIFSQSRFRELVANRANSLVRPVKWDDPFENALLKAQGILEDGTRVSVGFMDDLYGQCWTTNRDSDAMWRIYSPNMTGVRVRTTVGRLYEGLVASCPQYHEISCFIGKVEYLSADSIVSRFTDSDWATSHVLDTSGCGQAATLLLKRPEFSHEKEVRLIYFANEKNRTDGDVYSYSIDPFALIDEVAFDPRWESGEFFAAKVEAEKAGFSNVVQSELYRLPEFTWKVGKF